MLVEINEDQFHLREDFRHLRIAKRFPLETLAWRTPGGPEINHEGFLLLLGSRQGVSEEFWCILWLRRLARGLSRRFFALWRPRAFNRISEVSDHLCKLRGSDRLRIMKNCDQILLVDPRDRNGLVSPYQGLRDRIRSAHSGGT